MPVIGHAFVGMATALSARPPQAARAVATWMPAMVGLAYLPDIANQLAQLAGLGNARLVTHSLVFAVLASAAVAWPWSRFAGFSFRRAMGLSLLSILIHDLLDLLQATDRAPLWPFSDRGIGLGRELIPSNIRSEMIAFAGLFAMFVVIRFAWTRRRPARDAAGRAPHRGARFAGRATVASLFAMAAVTHLLRAQRERELDRAWDCMRQARYAEAISIAEGARRWPSTTKPGRIDYLEGEAWLGIGDRPRAEAHYRRSVDADPDYFWSLADLALFYAGQPNQPSRTRRETAMPYVLRLQRDFAHDAGLPHVLEKLRRRLESESSGR